MEVEKSIVREVAERFILPISPSAKTITNGSEEEIAKAFWDNHKLEGRLLLRMLTGIGVGVLGLALINMPLVIAGGGYLAYAIADRIEFGNAIQGVDRAYSYLESKRGSHHMVGLARE